MSSRRLNLSAIESSLRGVQRDFDMINDRLTDQRDPLTDEVVANMMSGYREVDLFLAGKINPFADGNSSNLLKLNRFVLCGDTDGVDKCQAKQLKASEKFFYRESGIGDVMEWLGRHEHDSSCRKASGVFARVMSQPQLFIEGNHRTGALLMSYILASSGYPPFVLTIDNALAYFEPSSLIKKRKKSSFDELLSLPRLTKKFAAMLQENADERFLV